MRTQNRNAIGGTLQDGVVTMLACMRRCNRFRPGTDQVCYGLDFNTRNPECWIFFQPYTLGQNVVDNVDNYRREFKCEDTAGKGFISAVTRTHSVRVLCYLPRRCTIIDYIFGINLTLLILNQGRRNRGARGAMPPPPPLFPPG